MHLDFTEQVSGRNAVSLVGPDGAIPFREASAAAALEAGAVEGVPWERTQLMFATGALQALSLSAREAVREAFRLGGAWPVFERSTPLSCGMGCGPRRRERCRGWPSRKSRTPSMSW